MAEQSTMIESEIAGKIRLVSENEFLAITDECTNCGACEVAFEAGFGIGEEWAYLKRDSDVAGWNSQECDEAIAVCPTTAILRKRSIQASGASNS